VGRSRLDIQIGFALIGAWSGEMDHMSRNFGLTIKQHLRAIHRSVLLLFQPGRGERMVGHVWGYRELEEKELVGWRCGC
jgi:hypothetical protein